MKKITILENQETLEISTFLKMLRGRVKEEKNPRCNINLLEDYIQKLDRET